MPRAHVSFRYRYKGKFISAGKAASLANLAGPSKHIRSERVVKGKWERSVPGFRRTVEKHSKESLAKERAERRGTRPESEIRKESRRGEARERAAAEAPIVADLARKIAKRAESKDVTPAEAADYYADDIEGLEYYDYGDVETAVDDWIDFGGEFFDFEMQDLEDEDWYSATK